MYDSFSKSAELNPDVPEPGQDDEGDFFYNNSEIQNNLTALSVNERAQQNQLLQGFNAVNSNSNSNGTGTATATATATTAKPIVIGSDAKDGKAKETPEQTAKKIHSLFESLPAPTPQLAAALVAAKPKSNATAATVVPANFDDADEDDDEDTQMS
jgi:hypothetical protein